MLLCCQDHFIFDLPSVSWSKRVKKFEANFMLVIICCVKLLIVNNDTCNLACIVACNNNNLFTLVDIMIEVFVRGLII